MHTFFNMCLWSLLPSSSRESATGVYEGGTKEVSEQGKNPFFAPKEYQIAGDLVTADIRIRRTLQEASRNSSE